MMTFFFASANQTSLTIFLSCWLVQSVTPACLESFLKKDSEQVGMTAGSKDSRIYPE